jgi:deoxyribodipyrimidine photolyase
MTMSAKVSITLDDDVLRFVDRQAAKNRSSFINEVLWREQQRLFLEELSVAYREQSADPVFQEEFAAWDVTLSDGLRGDA